MRNLIRFDDSMVCVDASWEHTVITCPQTRCVSARARSRRRRRQPHAGMMRLRRWRGCDRARGDAQARVHVAPVRYASAY